MSRAVGWVTAEPAPPSPAAPGWRSMMYPPAAHTPARIATASTPTVVSQAEVCRPSGCPPDPEEPRRPAGPRRPEAPRRGSRSSGSGPRPPRSPIHTGSAAARRGTYRSVSGPGSGSGRRDRRGGSATGGGAGAWEVRSSYPGGGPSSSGARRRPGGRGPGPDGGGHPLGDCPGPYVMSDRLPKGGQPAMSGEHYFTAEPGAPDRRHQVIFQAGGRDFALLASAGVFSAGRLDPGTAVLLRKAPLPGPRGGVYLDLGCGYGPIAVVLATVSEKAEVYAVDVNARALDLVRANASTLGLVDRIHAVAPEEVPPGVVFDEIWSNPPIRVGKAELHELLAAWLPRLAPGGTAWLVVARHLGADSLQAWLAGHGWATERYASQKGYRVLRVTAA